MGSGGDTIRPCGAVGQRVCLSRRRSRVRAPPRSPMAPSSNRSGRQPLKLQMWVRVPQGSPRRKKPAPFRFRGLRRSRENSTSADSFLLLPIEPRFDGDRNKAGCRSGHNGVALKASVRQQCRPWVRAPPPSPRRKKPAPFRFCGLRRSRENSTSAGSFLLLPIEPRFNGGPIRVSRA